METAEPIRGELEFEVGGVLPWTEEPVKISATAILPAEPPAAVMVCLPGGSYPRSYWDMHVPGHPGYSFADFACARGVAVVAADPLGVGRSSHPADFQRVDAVAMADANAEFTRQVRAALADGSLVGSVGPLPDVPLIGAGHSLGGCITVITMARSGCFDGIAILGMTHGAKDSVTTAAAEADEIAAATEQAKMFFPNWDDGYATAPRKDNHSWLFTDATPAEVIAVDDETETAWPRQAFVDGLRVGYSAGLAAEVKGPVFLAFGDQDIPERPRDDVGFYTGSDDVTMVVLEGAAHAHNFAPTREILWARMVAWARGLADGDLVGWDRP